MEINGNDLEVENIIEDDKVFFSNTKSVYLLFLSKNNENLLENSSEKYQKFSWIIYK